MTYKFYDTNSLLLKGNTLFSNLEEDESIVISSITLGELEKIKTSSQKDQNTKYQSRALLRFLNNNDTKYQTIIFNSSMLSPIVSHGFEDNADSRILATVISFINSHPDDNVIFITNDLLLKSIAKTFIKSNQLFSVDEEDPIEEYDGYKIINMNDDEMAYFYSHMDKNLYELHINEYLIICNSEGEYIESLCWIGEGYRRLQYNTFSSHHFGNIKPMRGDIYQALYADSLMNNKLTLVKGPAGSGKTFLAISYLFSLLEKGKIDKIIVFCNTIATKNSAKLG